jgi:hypothetical protein
MGRYKVFAGEVYALFKPVVLVSSDDNQSPGKQGQDKSEESRGDGRCGHGFVCPFDWLDVRLFGGLAGGAIIFGAGMVIAFGDGYRRVARWRQFIGWLSMAVGLNLGWWGWLLPFFSR